MRSGRCRRCEGGQEGASLGTNLSLGCVVEAGDEDVAGEDRSRRSRTRRIKRSTPATPQGEGQSNDLLGEVRDLVHKTSVCANVRDIVKLKALIYDLLLMKQGHRAYHDAHLGI